MFISGARVQRVTSSKRANAGTKGVARPEREAQILAAACRTFGERGYAATSVADVADAAGISKLSGFSTISVSVVSSMPAIEAALTSAERVTLTGSRTPWATRSPYSPVAAL
jgi:hypothetical protein